ncbi:nematocyst expressed protein 6 [Exaiptasia diaphana]|uniref:Metalloendopeptidase n=1 Tax=Exaiptasia diaphana TaxID=2652724 RepID=A0A913XCZ7_EXADI|nr:nematocyst expressed protein 6 [Exaiptasia diaphana]KXJ13273.1 Nematocyte expressed protein 6 [Exaiptasia diaphana]
MLENKWVRDQFEKANEKWVDSRGFKYDYDSIMHYSKWQGAKNKKSPVMESKKKEGKNFGENRKGLSAGDIKQIGKMYKCNANDESELPDYVPKPGEDEVGEDKTDGPKPGDVEE